MTALPIKRIILYKHGVGYFERRGPVQGETLRLTFPRPAMDDVLKSLIALDRGNGQVLSLDFETPEDRAELLAKGSIHLSDTRTLLDLVRDLRGRQVRCRSRSQNDQHGGNGDAGRDEETEGVVVGVTCGGDKPLDGAVVSIYRPDQQQVQTIPLADIRHLHLLDETAAADLRYFLRAAQSEEDRRSATLHLSPGDHDILVGYIAPAPAWRVSYRMLVERSEPEAPPSQPPGGSPSAPTTLEDRPFTVLLQGWGLFDNQLEEDLEQVHLTLVAGMPVSFRYRLYEPKTPERPLVQDEERTVNAPVFFEGAPPPAPAPAAGARMRGAKQMRAMTLGMAEAEEDAAFAPEAPPSLSIDAMDQSVQIAASGGERGALFAYTVRHPVSVARGQSAMVPILGQQMPCRRDLLYNGRKLPDHPVASLRLTNETGLTLERGPVTVTEDGDYAGEAVVPFTRAGGEVIVPFAVELGVKVEEQRSRERRIVSIGVREEYLLIQEYELHHTVYHLTSTLSTPVDVVIEHSPLPNYELTDTPDPAERTATFVRWSVWCAANARTVFEVHERRMQRRHERVQSVSGKQLQDYLHHRYLDEAIGQGLEEVLQLYRQMEETRKQVNQIEQERQAIYKHQKQIQGNLSPLGREGEEGALRKRYVAELGKLEDRLTALHTEERRLEQQVARLDEQARQKLHHLTQKDKEQEKDQNQP